MGLGTVRAPDIADPHCQFFPGHVTAQDALLDGHIKALQVHPDIWLHAVEGCDLRTLTSRTMAEQGLHMVIVLEGHVDVAFGPVCLQLPAPPSHPDAAPQPPAGALVHTCQRETFVRHWRMGKFERKLSLRIHPRMLQTLVASQGYPHLQAMLGQHLWTQHWQPSSRAVVLAEQIIHLASQHPVTLLLQSRVLELVHEALQQRAESTPAAQHPSLPVREHLRMSKLKAMLDARQDAGMPVSQLARTLGLSPSALQRHFRQAYGSSIDEYRRTLCLDQAHALLTQTGCSVLHAAHASGYTSAANFSTAFKRHFGVSPKLVRSKL